MLVKGFQPLKAFAHLAESRAQRSVLHLELLQSLPVSDLLQLTGCSKRKDLACLLGLHGQHTARPQPVFEFTECLLDPRVLTQYGTRAADGLTYLGATKLATPNHRPSVRVRKLRRPAPERLEVLSTLLLPVHHTIPFKCILCIMKGIYPFDNGVGGLLKRLGSRDAPWKLGKWTLILCMKKRAKEQWWRQ